MGHRYPQKHSLGKILNVTLIMVILPEVENWELRVGLFSVHSSKFVQKAFIISGITFMKIKINFLNNYVQNVQSKKKKKLEQIYSLVQRCYQLFCWLFHRFCFASQTNSVAIVHNSLTYSLT